MSVAAEAGHWPCSTSPIGTVVARWAHLPLFLVQEDGRRKRLHVGRHRRDPLRGIDSPGEQRKIKDALIIVAPTEARCPQRPVGIAVTGSPHPAAVRPIDRADEEPIAPWEQAIDLLLR